MTMSLVVETFISDCSDKAQACKVLEEAAEAFGAWQNLDEQFRVDDYIFTLNECDSGTSYNDLCVRLARIDLADEIADVIQAACNLAARFGIDVGEAMKRCYQRNVERGRYDQPRKAFRDGARSD